MDPFYMNSTSENPTIHPQWQPEYFGDAIIVNGKAWPYLKVQRRKYRFRIVNTGNARFYRFALSNRLYITQIGSNSSYLPRPMNINKLLLSPSEITDVIIDFTKPSTDEAIITNSAPYPYPSESVVDNLNSKVMKFVIDKTKEPDTPIPKSLVSYPLPKNDIARTRYITLYEYDSATGNPTHLFLNALPFLAPAIERQGKNELWHTINITPDNHPLHIHLGLFKTLNQIKLVNLTQFESYMNKMNDVVAKGFYNNFSSCTSVCAASSNGLEPSVGMRPFSFLVTRILFAVCNMMQNNNNKEIF